MDVIPAQMHQDYREAIYPIYQKYAMYNHTLGIESLSCGLDAMNELVFQVFHAAHKHQPSEQLDKLTDLMRKQYRLMADIVSELGILRNTTAISELFFAKN